MLDLNTEVEMTAGKKSERYISLSYHEFPSLLMSSRHDNTTLLPANACTDQVMYLYYITTATLRFLNLNPWSIFMLNSTTVIS